MSVVMKSPQPYHPWENFLDTHHAQGGFVLGDFKAMFGSPLETKGSLQSHNAPCVMKKEKEKILQGLLVSHPTLILALTLSSSAGHLITSC